MGYLLTVRLNVNVCISENLRVSHYGKHETGKLVPDSLNGGSGGWTPFFHQFEWLIERNRHSQKGIKPEKFNATKIKSFRISFFINFSNFLPPITTTTSD